MSATMSWSDCCKAASKFVDAGDSYRVKECLEPRKLQIIKGVARDVSPESPFVVFLYSAALAVCPPTAFSLRILIILRRMRAHRQLGNELLVHEDASEICKLSEMMGGDNEEAVREARQAQEEAAAIAATPSGPVGCSPVEAMHSAIDFGQEWLAEMQTMLERYHCRMTNIAGGRFVCPRSENLTPNFHQLELLSLGAQPRFREKGVWQARKDGLAVRTLCDDLASLLCKPHGFKPTQLVHHISDALTGDLFKWWKSYLDRGAQTLKKGGWTVMAVDCWIHVTPAWRHICMRRAMSRLCRDMPMVEPQIIACPELSEASFQEMSKDPSRLLVLSELCASHKGSTYSSIARWHVIDARFYDHNVKSDVICMLRCYLEKCKTLTSEDVDYLVEDWIYKRWHFLSFFCYYTLLIMLSVDDDRVIYEPGNKLAFPKGFATLWLSDAHDHHSAGFSKCRQTLKMTATTMAMTTSTGCARAQLQHTCDAD